MKIAGYYADNAVWCPDCARRLYGDPQIGELIILDAAGEAVMPIPDPGSALHLVVSCAGGCGASVPKPRHSLAHVSPEIDLFFE